jgi:hypothetical protein
MCAYMSVLLRVWMRVCSSLCVCVFSLPLCVCVYVRLCVRREGYRPSEVTTAMKRTGHHWFFDTYVAGYHHGHWVEGTAWLSTLLRRFARQVQPRTGLPPLASVVIPKGRMLMSELEALFYASAVQGFDLKPVLYVAFCTRSTVSAYARDCVCVCEREGECVRRSHRMSRLGITSAQEDLCVFESVRAAVQTPAQR